MGFGVGPDKGTREVEWGGCLMQGKSEEAGPCQPGMVVHGTLGGKKAPKRSNEAFRLFRINDIS